MKIQVGYFLLNKLKRKPEKIPLSSQVLERTFIKSFPSLFNVKDPVQNDTLEPLDLFH